MGHLNSKIAAIDPGLGGALVFLSGRLFRTFNWYPMPVKKDKRVCLKSVITILRSEAPDKVFLEQALPMAMGAKHAFNYGRDFAALETAIMLLKIPCDLIRPNEWTKVMHGGTNKDLRPKVRSSIAVEKHFRFLLDKIPKTPKSKKYHDGVVDALLIAAYGLASERLKRAQCVDGGLML